MNAEKVTGLDAVMAEGRRGSDGGQKIMALLMKALETSPHGLSTP